MAFFVVKISYIIDCMETSIEKIKEDSKQLRRDVRQQMVSYILAGFGVVAGLAWNDAVKALIEYIFPLGQNTLLAKFIYAFLVTILVVVTTVYLMRLTKSDDTEDQK